MMPHQVKERIESGLAPGTEAVVNEFSGGDDHYSVLIISSSFNGLPLIKRHRLVMDLFQTEIESGEVHALTIRALTPEQWSQEQRNT